MRMMLLMKGAFFSWSWLSQKHSFGNGVFFGWFYTTEVHTCVPQCGGAGITENVAVWLCKRACCLQLGSAGGWMEAGVRMAIFWAADVSCLTEVADSHTHTECKVMA